MVRLSSRVTFMPTPADTRVADSSRRGTVTILVGVTRGFATTSPQWTSPSAFLGMCTCHTPLGWRQKNDALGCRECLRSTGGGISVELSVLVVGGHFSNPPTVGVHDQVEGHPTLYPSDTYFEEFACSTVYMGQSGPMDQRGKLR